MLNKLLKYELKRSFSWLWILALITLISCSVTRLVGIGSGAFFVILNVIFVSISVTLAVNVLLQPFIRIFVGFQKDLYGDESYLMHTLPVTKNQIFASKLLSALIQLLFAFVIFALSLFIIYYSPANSQAIMNLINLSIQSSFPGATISATAIILLLVLLVIIQIFTITASIITSIVVVNKNCQSKKNLISVLVAFAIIYAENFLTGIVAFLAMLIFGASLSQDTMPPQAMIGAMCAYMLFNVLLIIVHILVSKKVLNQGVNVD